VVAEGVRIAGSRLATAAGIVGLAVDVAYVAIILEQGESRLGRVAFVAVFILAVSTFAIFGVSSFTRSPGPRLIMLGAAAGGFLTIGVIGIFSIGLPLLVAGTMCGIAWVRSARAMRPVPGGVPLLSGSAAIATGAILVFGISLS
jgi:hypothetical protein